MGADSTGKRNILTGLHAFCLHTSAYPHLGNSSAFNMDGVILNEVLSTYSRGLFSFLLVVILQAAGSFLIARTNLGNWQKWLVSSSVTAQEV